MPPAARVTDMHTCPKVEPGPVPHVGGPVLPAGEPTVLIGFMPAARVTDKLVNHGAFTIDAAGSFELPSGRHVSVSIVEK